MKKAWVWAILASIYWVNPLLSQPKANEPVRGNDWVKTSHRVGIHGQEIEYTATVGTMPIKDQKGEEKAGVFFIAYTRDGIHNQANRPVTFSFNGGPGAASVWLHLGALGPRRVLMDPDGNPLPPPSRLVDNGYSVLDQTDLVFIDPVSTGYSRSAKDVPAADFHNVPADVDHVAEFVRLYLTRMERWSSPKFIIGESYGTVRAAALVNRLQQRHGVYPNGVMLVSAALDYQTADVHPGNDLPYVLLLPTYTATAWIHGRLQGFTDLNQAVKEAERFAMGPYHTALMRGDLLDEAQKNEIAAGLSRLIGLNSTYIKEKNLRVRLEAFSRELLRSEGKTCGRLDTRLVGHAMDPSADEAEYDPSFAAILGPYSNTIYDYLVDDLGFKTDKTYWVSGDVWRTWKWPVGDYINVAEDLRIAMTQNPHLQVYVGSGYFDLATPYFATEYTFNHMGLDPSQQRRVTFAYYESGHMMYIHMPSLAKFKADLVAFMDSALK